MAPGNGVYLSTLARCHVELGETLKRRGDLAAAEEALRKGIGIAERAAADFPQSYALQATLGWSHVNLGWVDNCQRCHMPTRWEQATVQQAPQRR